jgi:hypothetical protein
VRRRFADLIARQLDLFLEEEADLVVECREALERYDAADRDEAEERYGDYLDLVESGTEILADLRDGYARTLDSAAADVYETEFNRAVAKRLPHFALELENR